MEHPLFYQGQRVVCQNSTPNPDEWMLNPFHPRLIDGKSYYVSNPDADREDGLVWITISGIGERRHFWQGQFVPYEADHQLEEQIFESLKGSKIYLHKEPKEY